MDTLTSAAAYMCIFLHSWMGHEGHFDLSGRVCVYSCIPGWDTRHTLTVCILRIPGWDARDSLTSAAAHMRVFLHFCSRMWQWYLPFASVICIRHFHISHAFDLCRCHLHPSFATVMHVCRLHLSYASVVCICHLHLSFTSVICIGQLRLSLASVICACRLHL